MYDPFYLAAAYSADDRFRRAEEARALRRYYVPERRVRSGGGWLKFLTRSRPAVPYLVDPDPGTEVPVDDPWSEAA